MLEHLIETYGYRAVLVGTFLEGETVQVLAGFGAHQGYLQLPVVMLAACIGSLAGDQLLFYPGCCFYAAGDLFGVRIGGVFDHDDPVEKFTSRRNASMNTTSNDKSGVLAGQRALVTGANSGIGEAVAKGLAAAGASVVVNYVSNEAHADQVVKDIKNAGGNAMAVHADVSREDQVKTMFSRMVAAYGGIDILVNNAGLQRDAPFQDMTLEQWHTVISVNLTGQFLCAREAAREFIRHGVVPGLSKAAGKIICISSVHQAIPWSRHANYAASKGGVLMLMQTMAQELAPRRIRVNAIAPGAIKTPINRSAWETPEAERELLQLIPYGHIGSTADVANAAVWLASDQSDYITGATLFIDGGMMLYPGFRTGG